MEMERRSKDRDKDRRQFLVDVSGDSKWAQLKKGLAEIYCSDKTTFSINDKTILLRMFKSAELSSFLEAGAYDKELLLHILIMKWQKYYGLIVPTLEAVFLPLQLEFKEAISSKFNSEINIGELSFIEFRNSIILPLLPIINNFVNSCPQKPSDISNNPINPPENSYKLDPSTQNNLLFMIQMLAVLLELPNCPSNKELMSLAIKMRSLL
ncbi:hypothetical protein BB561_001655 [Smittium simulii]|uniref:Uncharacterized protein n=1 Tax=Smittium simulii TaxID=133385 RepID=A0A2T9YTN3_9FUNG|nr:hypothetical protein BB561_001655 [Smittium simulii]